MRYAGRRLSTVYRKSRKERHRMFSSSSARLIFISMDHASRDFSGSSESAFARESTAASGS
jgi:hypothetical protein